MKELWGDKVVPVKSKLEELRGHKVVLANLKKVATRSLSCTAPAQKMEALRGQKVVPDK